MPINRRYSHNCMMRRFLLFFAFLLCYSSNGLAQIEETLINDFIKYRDAGQYEQAIDVGNRLLDIFSNNKESNEFGIILSAMASCYYSNGNYNKAIELENQAIEIYKLPFGKNISAYLISLNNLARCYARLGDYAKATELGTQALEISKQELGEKHPDYAMSLSNLAGYYADLGDYNKAVELGTLALEIRKQELGEKHPDYAMSLSNLAGYYADLGDYNKAAELGTQALEIRKQELGEKHPDYAMSLSNLASYYFYLGDYSKAIELETLAIEIRKLKLGENHPDYATSVNNLASYYSALGNYEKAIELGELALDKREESLGRHHPSYALSLNNLSTDYACMGDYAKAIELGIQSLEIRKRVLGEKHPDYAKSLNNLANYYSEIGDYVKSFEYTTQALEIRKKVLGENHLDYAQSLEDLASRYSDVSNYVMAIEFETKAMEIIKSILGETHPKYATSLDNLARFYSYLGNYTKAIKLGTTALKIKESIIDKNHPDYAASLNNLASYYCEIGDYIKAREFGTQAMEIRKRVLGENHPYYSTSLSNLAWYYFLTSNYSRAASLYGKKVDANRSNLLKVMAGLASSYRHTYWDKYQADFLNYYPALIYLRPTDSLICSLYDNSCLFAKGLLLTAETDMRQLILESGDEAVLAKFNELQSTRMWLNKLNEIPIAERHVNTDSLENIAERLESDLVLMSKTYGDFMHNLKITWKEVQANLGDEDVAVEFLSFSELNTSKTIYIALSVRKGYNAPHMIRLFEESEMEAIKSFCYSGNDFSKLVWGRMEKELEGVENIYFSPCDELYNIAIESMPHWKQECMISDRFNLYRLSSTRELAIFHDETNSSGAVLYGGINYNTDVASMGNPKSDVKSHFDADSTNYRGTKWSYLSGTLNEVNEIEAILVKGDVSVSKLAGANATETSFKDLSGKKKRILHIATHGFFWNDSTAKKRKEDFQLRFVQLGNDQPCYVEDKAMTRSGLLFAGAQNTFDGIKIPAGVDDGVLIAQEIAQLDLRGLDLLVLSACETGIGEIKGDGVFGLQRGFKKAGTMSILMSLCQVDDLSTNLFMTEFYRDYISGESKQKSLKLAQKYVREYKDKDGK